jgi:hypothetical protein
VTVRDAVAGAARPRSDRTAPWQNTAAWTRIAILDDYRAVALIYAAWESLDADIEGLSPSRATSATFLFG